MPPPSYTVVGIEGEALQVAMQANANPMTITYTWMKDGAPINNGNGNGNGIERIVSDGAVLNITKLTRNDAGIYTCKAQNSQGSATMNITVIVECKFLMSKNHTIFYANSSHFTLSLPQMEQQLRQFRRIS